MVACALPAAAVRGRVELVNSREAAVVKKKDYSGVVLWLAPAEGRAGGAAPRNGTATIDQKDKMFKPHILAVEVGTRVAFPNSDPIFHNAFSNYEGRVFDVGLYAPGTSRSVKFDRAGVVRVFCNIHASMSAVVVVTPGPWFATTAAAGQFEMADVPEGEYTLKVFHERATPETLKKLVRRVTVSGGVLDLGSLAISETGFLPLPHKNKYGSEYGPENENNHLYPAPRK
jgi:plastocyanin